MSSRRRRNPKKKNKKSNPKVNGRTLKNNFEIKVYKGIRSHLKKYKRLEYETEKLPYVMKHNYIPDFIITRKDGSKLYIEAKGYFDLNARRKMLEVKEQHPELDIRILFETNKRIRKGSKTLYSDWCDKNEYQYAFGEVPEEWYEND